MLDVIVGRPAVPAAPAGALVTFNCQFDYHNGHTIIRVPRRTRVLSPRTVAACSTPTTKIPRGGWSTLRRRESADPGMRLVRSLPSAWCAARARGPRPQCHLLTDGTARPSGWDSTLSTPSTLGRSCRVRRDWGTPPADPQPQPDPRSSLQPEWGRSLVGRPRSRCQKARERPYNERPGRSLAMV